MSLMRVLRTTRVSLTHVFYVDEAPTDATGPVTITVKRLDGTLVQTGSAVHASVGTYTFELTEQSSLDILTVEWQGIVAGGATTAVDTAEIVGGFIFDLNSVRAAHSQLSNTTKYPASLLAHRRIATEQECEGISGRAWVPRFARFQLDGSGTTELVLPDIDIRAIRSCKLFIDGGWTTVSLTSLIASSSGIVFRAELWPAGYGNIIIEYEHGQDGPPEYIRLAAIQRMRWWMTMSTGSSTIPSRALSYTSGEGGTYRLSLAGPKSTGEPDVDAAYRRDAFDDFWITK